MNMLFNGFEGSNEEKMGRLQRKSFYSEIWGDAFQGDGLVRIQWDSPCVMVLWKLSSTCG